MLDLILAYASGAECPSGPLILFWSPSTTCIGAVGLFSDFPDTTGESCLSCRLKLFVCLVEQTSFRETIITSAGHKPSQFDSKFVKFDFDVRSVRTLGH